MASKQIKTSPAHRGYTLIKLAYPVFGVVFIYLFSTDFWFESNLSYFGLAIILVVMAVSHIFLLFYETDRACRLFYIFYRGKPPACYINWLMLENLPETTATGSNKPADSSEPAEAEKEPVSEQEVSPKDWHDVSVRTGLKRLKLQFVDELYLSIWGNLIFRSRALCGTIVEDEGAKRFVGNRPDELLKIPFGAITCEQQQEFVELVKKVRPDLILNKRLEKKLSSKIVKGEDMIQALGAVFLCYVLLDLGHSLSGYLEMLKHYHLAQVAARRTVVTSPAVPVVDGGTGSSKSGNDANASKQADSGDSTEEARNRQEATEHLKLADEIRESPPMISVVKRALLDKGFTLGSIMQARAEALWRLDRREEAIESLEKAIELYPRSLKWQLEKVRWLSKMGELKKARKILADLIDEHEDVLLPRLYMLVSLEGTGDKKRVDRFYEIYLDQLDLLVFGEEPCWPPGSNRYLSDSWTREDIIYLIPILLKNEKATH